MTQKYIGEIQLTGNAENFKITMPEAKSIPPKQEWSKWPIWQFNGKAYLPLTQKAENNLVDTIKKIESLGKTKATKQGKLKPTSIRYAILTTGVEPFYYI